MELILPWESLLNEISCQFVLAEVVSPHSVGFHSVPNCPFPVYFKTRFKNTDVITLP